MEGRFLQLQFEFAVERSVMLSFNGPNTLKFSNRSIPPAGARKCMRWSSGITTKSVRFTPRSTGDFSVLTESAPMGEKTVYEDGLIDKMAIDYLSKCLQNATGKSTNMDGYEGLIDVVSKTSQSFSAIEQRKLSVLALKRAVPKLFSLLCRTLLRPSKFAWEYYAASAPNLFRWLVGPCEVRETEIEGLKNVVHIKKCRILESTNCVGMCLNLCKLPTQQFIAEEFGVPVTLTPNFEDMSCDMVFGRHPPPIAEDPALKQPCYKTLCKLKKKHSEDCSTF